MRIESEDVIGSKGMITCDNQLAAPVGRDTLLAGGNAVDAAVATALALCVVQPSSNGIGGYGGTMVIYLTDAKKVISIDYNTRAPKAARPDMYELAEGWEAAGPGKFPQVVGRKNFFGALAVSVPATVAGLYLAESKFGRLGWSRVIQPAIKLASEGITVYPELEQKMSWLPDFADEESLRAVLPDGPLKTGDEWKQPDLARLMEKLADDPMDFYKGVTARRIVERVQGAEGILSEADLAEYSLDISEPMTLDFRGCKIHSSPGFTGGVTSLEALGILECMHPYAYAPDDAEYWGDMAEAVALAWHDRFAFVGDGPGGRTKLRQLVSAKYCALQADKLKNTKVRTQGKVPSKGQETVHICTCDERRNIVSLTQTHGGGWGTAFAVPGLGLMLGHGMSRFDPRPGNANSIRPGREVLHNMSPIIITVDGEATAAFGAPGGRHIPSLIPQFVVNLVDFGMTPAETLRRPRIHAPGEEVLTTEALPKSARKAIESRGFSIREVNAIAGTASGLMAGRDRIVGAGTHADAAIEI